MIEFVFTAVPWILIGIAIASLVVENVNNSKQ